MQKGLAKFEAGAALRRGGEHEQDARRRRRLGCGRGLHPDPWRLRLREEYDIERKYREARLYQVAPISTNMILSYIGEHVLGMPRSY